MKPHLFNSDAAATEFSADPSACSGAGLPLQSCREQSKGQGESKTLGEADPCSGEQFPGRDSAGEWRSSTLAIWVSHHSIHYSPVGASSIITEITIWSGMCSSSGCCEELRR